MIDAVIAKIIGYNISRIPTVYNALYNVKSLFSLLKNEEIYVKWIEDGEISDKSLNEINSFDFIPPKFWKRAMSKKS